MHCSILWLLQLVLNILFWETNCYTTSMAMCICIEATVHVQILREEWNLSQGLSRFQVHFSKTCSWPCHPHKLDNLCISCFFLKQFQDWCIDKTLPVPLVLLRRSADRCCRWRILPSFNWSVNAVMDSTSVLYSEGLA